MVTAIPPEHTVSIKPLELHPASPANPMTNDGTLMIRIKLTGIYSVEIVADESEIEIQLLDIWASLQPAVDAALAGPR